jgi:hypothetical protein
MQLFGAASDAVDLAFLRCGGASQTTTTRSTKTNVAHRRTKIERVYRPYLTATEAVCADAACQALCVRYTVEYAPLDHATITLRFYENTTHWVHLMNYMENMHISCHRGQA